MSAFAGKPPLAVTFALAAPKVAQWRVDFGDGLFKTGFGQPPASLAHTYAKAGDFKPRLTVLSAQGAAPQSATTSVSVQATPLISMIATRRPEPAARGHLQALDLGAEHHDLGDRLRRRRQGRRRRATRRQVVYHTYKKAGTYKPQFAVKPGQYALVYTVAQVTVGGGTAPVLALTATPDLRQAPARGEVHAHDDDPGASSSRGRSSSETAPARRGQGAPPASVSHTYAKAGTYAAFLVVAQQQKYGGVQYTAPRGGLAVSVG